MGNGAALVRSRVDGLQPWVWKLNYDGQTDRPGGIQVLVDFLTYTKRSQASVSKAT